MAWLDDAIERLTSRPVCGYRRGGSPAVEPTALTALALMAAGRRSQAREGLDWLARVQSDDGSLGIDADTRDPCWPTGWAVLAWNTAAQKIADARHEWSAAARIASAWILATRASRPEPSDEERRFLGQDPASKAGPG